MGERADEVTRAGRDDGGGDFGTGGGMLSAGDAGVVLNDNADETQEMRAGIEQTRAEMSETINAIQERLSPENIKEQVKEQVNEAVQSAKDSVREATVGRVESFMENVSETMGRAGTTVAEKSSPVIDAIRRNPLPAALIGLGVGMLVMNRNRGRSYRDYETDRERPEVGGYGGRVGEEYSTTQTGSRSRLSTPGRAGGALSSAATGARAMAGSALDQTREQASRLGDKVQEGARRAGDQFQTTLHENPLAVGAVAMALGVAVGLAAPATRVENEYMGEARDQLMDKAQRVARDTVDKVQQVAGEAGRAVQREAGNQGLTA